MGRTVQQREGEEEDFLDGEHIESWCRIEMLKKGDCYYRRRKPASKMQ